MPGALETCDLRLYGRASGAKPFGFFPCRFIFFARAGFFRLGWRTGVAFAFSVRAVGRIAGPCARIVFGFAA